jgi:uncharacterized protein YhdP
MPDKGITVSAKLATMNTDAWSDVWSLNASRSNAKELALPLPDRIDIRSNELITSNKKFNKLQLAVSRNNSVWQGDLSADELQGNFTWNQTANNGNGSVVAKFSRLSLPATSGSDITNALDNTTSEIPELDITIDNFSIQNHVLGKVSLKAINEGVGATRKWNLQDLSVSNPEAQFTAKGAWARANPNAPRITNLLFEMNVSDAGNLLERLGQSKVFRRGRGKMTGQVSWAGSPLSIDYPSLSGSFSLESKDGQFLKADPGVAKLLGVLSLQSLPRRITLDFRDVFSEGFAYDTINANVEINKGIASTKDFKMKGVSATVLLEGQADLDRETQSIHVLVLPDINAAGGSLVYSVIAANPAVGLATFLAQMILKDPLAKALSFEYEITGSWAEPNIKKLARKAPAESNTGGAN